MRERIKQARDRIEVVRLALTGSSPGEIVATLPALEEAVRCLETVERDLRDGACAPYEVRRELKLLKDDLRLNARLMEQGVAFCRGWSRMLGSGPTYTQAGQSAVPEPIATMSVRG
jgi:hypothetical protein